MLHEFVVERRAGVRGQPLTGVCHDERPLERVGGRGELLREADERSELLEQGKLLPDAQAVAIAGVLVGGASLVGDGHGGSSLSLV